MTKRMNPRKNWYVVHELLSFERKGKKRSKRSRTTVWENLILTYARNSNEAYRKALKRGRDNEGPVKIDGEDGYCRFVGLRELAHVYDELEDGAELEWREFQVPSDRLRRLVTPKRKLQTFMSKK